MRRLNISLSDKCQILFGTAVVLIIAATLFVPWQRMAGLEVQINERSAEILARSALEEHVRLQRAAQDGETPTTQPASLTWPATTQPIGNAPEATHYRSVLIPVSALEDPLSLTPFQRRAFQQIIRHNRQTYSAYYDLSDGAWGYQYALALHRDITESCLDCHAAPTTRQLFVSPPTTSPTTMPIAITPMPGSAETIPLPQDLLGIAFVDIPSQVQARQYLLNRIFLLIAAVLAASLASVVFYLITNKLILQPVRVLQETAEKVAEGDLDIRSDINTGDEFQQLSETFNTMLANLKQTEDQLRTINRNLDLKLNQLAESNLALYESNRLKSEFLANVSHELRTPLNSILGFAELLHDAVEKLGDSKSQRYTQNILKSGRNLLELINDLLDLAKIEAGRMEVRVEPLSLSDLFEGLSGILKPLLEQRELSINTHIARDVPIIHTDPAKLQQILYNFLSNAIKFSPRGGRITLGAVREDKDHIRVSVTDRGPGIDPSMHRAIFEKFRQLDASVTREHSGTGLGLAISKELAHLLGGQIGVNSALGEGATFWVIVPIKITPSTADVRGGVIHKG